MVGERYRSHHAVDPSDAQEKEVLDHYELNREKYNDERDNVQKKTFTKWVNKHLSKTDHKIDDLFVDLRDGYALIALLEALTGERIQKENGYTRFHRIQNVQYCLDFLKKKNIKLVNIRPEDIVEGNGKLTLGLIWTIILNFQVSVIRQRLLLESSQHEQMSAKHTTTNSQVSLHGSDATSARDALLQWARRVTAGYPRVNVNNFSSSWRDGLAFNAILHRYRSSAIDWNKISSDSVSNTERLNNAFAAADREFGVERLLDAEDVDTNNPDEKSIITYVSSLYNALPHEPEMSRLQKVQEEYIEEAYEWREWVVRAIQLVDDRHLQGTASELIYELQRFREDDLPPREEQKRRLTLVYEHLEKVMRSTELFAIPHELSAPELQRVWNELQNSIDRRFDVLERHRIQEGNSNDLLSRLARGIGITNEKLDLILKRIEDVEARVDTSPPAAVERTVSEIVDDLNALESPIARFFEDVEELKSMQHPEANDFYKQVYGLHQRRTTYLDRLTNQILVRLGVRTDSLHKENQQRLENMRKTSFSRVEECIEWVRVRMEKLTTMEFLEDLETLEHVFEQHKFDNRDIQDFRQNVDECIARQAEVSAEDTYEYCELLRVLESEYQQLRDLSAGRMLDLDSLIAFVRAAQLELIWVSERESIEVTRNWSDIKQLDLPMLTNYYKQLLHEMELREKQYNDVHNQGAALLNQGHPAIRVIEVYLRQMQSQWDWLLALSKCLEEHLRDALNLKSFMEEASDAEAWIQEQSVRLENNYNRTDFSLEEGERFLRELDEIKEILNKYHQVLMALTERCASISPLWQRGERIPHPIKVTALCDYSDENVTIKAGDDVYLLDNSDLIKWTIRDISGAEGQVPSVVFRIPPTDARLTALLNRLLQQFEKLKKLWDKKHRMVRFNMVLNTMRTIQGWDLDTFNSIDPDQRDAIMKALNDDANKLLSELDPNDPLALRLREELRRTNEHFWNLLNASQKPPEPDWASQYDQKMAELLKKLEEAWRELNDAVGKPISRSPEDLERVIHAHKRFEDALQALDSDVANVKELFRQLPNPTPTQRVNHDRLNGLWDDLWDLSRMYVERIKVLESVLNGMVEVADIVRQHEITLNSFDDLPAALDKLRGHHSQLLEINMVLKQQQTVIDQLNRNVALLRQHVSRTRINEGHHPDVDAIEDEVQKLNVRWENVNSQIASRLLAVESALQIQMVYRSEYETEMSWLDTVEETINRLRKPEELRPEQYQQQLDMLIAEYTNLQEHTQAIEHVNKEGGRFIHEAKIFDAKLGQYSDGIVGIHGPGIKSEFRRTKPQPKNGSQIVTEELELLNRRFAQLSSLILERRNTMQVLIQNWKRQKQENVTQVVSFREAEVSGMMTDLTRFRQEIFTTHLTFNSNPESIDAATKNVQNVKQSLDSWRDRIKERLDEIDRLCTEEGDSLTPEQYSALREMRRQLADEYDTVLRTVEGIHTRLNILSALLIEFSSVTSSMQSWMTDRTRLAGDIRHKSGDPMRIDEARFEAKSLMDEVIREESRLKTIGASVLKIEQEISAMRDDVRASGSTDDVGISVDEVYETRRRVEDDYMQLLRQCQDLISFQNRLHAMNDEHSEQARRADEWLQMLQNDVEDVDQDPRFQRDEDRIQRIEELNRMAAGGSSQLDDAEQASRRLLTALEGTNVANDVRARHEELANLRRGKHQKVIDRLSQNMMEAASRKAEAEGVKQAVENLRQWSEQTAQRTRQPVQLPLTELDLHEARKDEQVLHGEIENRLALIEELEKKAADVGDHASLAELQECKMKLKRSNSDLKGLRDNIFDAINGLQTVNSEGETLSRAVDSAGAKIRSARLPEAQSEVEALQDQADNLERITNNLCNIPNVTRTEPVIQKSKDLRKRVDSCAQELDARMGKLAELESLDAEFDGAKNKLSSFIGAFDDELKGLEKVSIDKEKLAEQRRQTQDLVDKHSEGNAILDDVEAIAQKVTAEDPSKTGSAQKSVGELGARLQRQASELKARGDKINKLDSKATSFAESEAAVLGYIEKQKDQLSTGFPVPATKEGVKSQLLDLERMNKTGKEEQRRVDDARHSARELAREASVEKEVQDMNQREKKLLDEWEDLADQFDAVRSRANKAEQVLNECAQMEKYIGAKKNMLEGIGAPSTEPGVAKANRAQIQSMKAETEGEKSALEHVNSLANELIADGGANVEELMKKMDRLNRKWHSLESGLDENAGRVEEAAKLGQELKDIQKELRKELGELESNVEKASAMSSNDIGDQLATLDSLKSRFGGVDKALEKLKGILEATEELEVDATNRAEIQEQLETTQKKADELERKIENVKKAALNAQNEGLELEKKLDELIGTVNSAENELELAAPIAAESLKLADELKRAEELFQKLIENEGDVSLIRAKVAEELKKKPDAELKKKLELLYQKWPKALGAARDRKDLVSKAGDLVKQFGDQVQALEQRLQGDQAELDELLASDKAHDPEVCDALKLVELTMARRLADVDALNAVMNRIESSAPGPDANRLRRRADTLSDDAKGMAKKARTAADLAQRKQGLAKKFERLCDEVSQFTENQKAEIQDAIEKDLLNAERVQSKLNKIDDFWSSNSRELKNVGDEIKIDATPEDAQAVDTKLAELQAGIDGLLATLQEQNVHLEEKREQANRVQSESQKAAGKINSLVAEIADLDPIGRSRDELQKQKKEVVELAGDLGSAQTKMLELGAEWEAALGAGIVAQPVFEMNRAATDELNKLAARAGKRLAQREKKITETEDEIDKLHADADQIVGALEAIAKDEALQGAPSQLLDPKQVSEKVRQLKESLKPVGEKMDAFNTDCKLLIKTAGPESDTKELDSLLKKVGDAYSDVVGKVSDKEMSVDAAVQQQGKVEDAYRALLNWLEETEEMMENRKKPSADAKVAKAQLHDYEVLMKHVEDKKPSVDGFKAMIEKIVAEASSDEEKKALGNKNAQIEDRYKDLLNSAVDRQRKLLDAVDLAERLQEVTIPLDSWLQSADKRLQALAKVPITVEKAEEMIGEQEALQDELEHKSDDLKDVLEIAPMLASLVSVEDANSISGQVNQLEARARALDAGITNMRPLLESFLQQIQDFTLDAEDMTQFVGETEVKLGELDELPIEPDDLVEQTNILAEIAVSIADRDEMMANIFEVGKQLAIQGEPEEALIAQKKLDDLKFRYADLMTSADEKIALLAKAIPLSEGFHEGFDTVMQVLEDMDRDLQTIDEEDPETQAELIFLLEEDISQKMRPSVDELTALSNQLQVLCSADKADELQTNTIAMNKLVNSVADRVARRAERIEMASKQSRAVLDDLQYLIEWFSAARERILEGAPPSLDLEVLKSQLKHQRITNEEASANKVQFRNVAGEAKKVARQLGMEGNEANEKISDTVDEGKELVEEVMALCADRTETLERALALMEQLTSQFDELNKWLDQMDAELQASPSVTTATPAAELREMHDHNEELARMVAAYRPIIEGFKSDVGSLHEVLAEDQAPLLESVAGELVQGYEEVREAVRARGHAIDNMMGATIGFGERLETLVANLQGAADRLRENEGISADPSVLESRLAENRSIVESLRDKQNAYDALKQTASELLASAPEGDAAAGDVENKLNRLEKLWKEIEREAVDRGVLLEDVLDKAKHFWSELDSCQKAVDDLRNRLELVEPATGHPEQLADQQEIMAQVASEMERARPRIEALSIAGKQLADYVPDDEKAVIENQVANVRGGFSTITGLFAEKKRDLIAAMEEAMTFHGDLQELLKWLDMAEQKLLKMSPVEHAKHMTEIEQLLKELHTFKDEVHERGVAKEQVVATALQLAADAPPHLAATVRQPVADLNTRWSRLNAALAEREHKLENLMLQMGKLASTIAQLTAWMDKTRATLKDIAPPKNAVNLRDIEIAQCKLVVLSNDIHAHQDSVNAVNRAAQKYIQTSGALDAETSDSLKSMNLKWEDIQKVLESLAFDMEVAKKEAENVGGEVEKWQRWLEETESALLSTKPTGGLPETAEFQLDEFKALKLDVEHNASPLEAHLHATEQHLKEEPQDADTWLSKTHGAMKTKWNKVKELLVDREKKLQVAYEQAVALESALNDMEDWIIAAERKLTDQPSISRLPDVIEKQLAEHESWMEEVAGRKMAMTKHQASGVHMQYYCEKKDAIPIKNRLVSLKHRVEKISGRTAERAKQLAVTRDEVATWQDGLHDLEHFISDVLVKIAPEPNTTSSLEKLKAKLEEVKEAQRDVTAKQTLFDVTRKRGIGLAERATRSEYKQISMTNEKMSKKWAEMLKKLRDRLREAEQAVLEGGAFEESMNDLESWVDDELERYQKAEHEPVFADIDGVRALVDEESRRSAERKTKENGVKTVVKKADALMASGVDEKDSIAQAKERLVEKWNQVEEAARHRGNSIKEAEQAAEEFDAKTHALLDWLAVEEQKLKASGLDEVEGVKQEMDEAKGRYQECLKKGEEILSKCQPAAEPILRNWMRVVEARWKEVSEKVDEREFTLLEQEQKAKEQNEQIEKLAKFAAQKREELNRMIEQPPAQDLDTMEQNICDFANLDSELREQQPEVDAACKSAKKGARNPAAEMLSTEWKKLWLDAMGLQSSLDNQKALLEEMKRLEGWKWEDWKERYVEWNDHAKARVNDLFRRIDRLHTGNVPRQVFIDGIIGSKFPTSRLEMAKVADRFDKGDGMINAKEFINALRFDASNRNAKPQTDTEKITHEIELQKKTCSCCTPYQIEKISENHYRFGDTHIKRMVRILRSTVMVRVGGGWESLDEFLHKHDPCRAKGRLNINMFPEARPIHALDSMRSFTKNRHGKQLPTTGTPGPIMKIREKTDRSVPMSGGLGGTAGYTVTTDSHRHTDARPSRIPRAPSDMSAGRLSRVGSVSNSKNSIVDSSTPSRPESRASSDAGDRQTRIPSLRARKGQRYIPQGPSSSSSK
ncbi:Spectrin beta chain [Caenorhabditis elegans]|uniref:Spectrin beta chain n=1 Tax=Caenorhabditis elegans TaxID=6239 RepID=A0A1N7SYN9_CAEEL|nr:Spectrin beta chain [Caenorhabditis elegans]SIT60409.1 Spectrin beta chain [Caenorhabditis elegans]|eukprot:NP_001335519.1 Uncharacterized protein CELE_ZK1151.1 [Caenorhabditis elegans]